jgi:hypothetical protein
MISKVLTAEEHYINNESCYQPNSEEAGDYLPHLRGAANYAVIDNVASLPLIISDIHHRLTT